MDLEGREGRMIKISGTRSLENVARLKMTDMVRPTLRRILRKNLSGHLITMKMREKYTISTD